MNRRTWFVTVLIAVAGSRAMASDNWLTTLALHAVTVTDGAVCELEPDPCEWPNSPRITVAGGERVALYVLARNYDEISGLQAAFDWGDWEFLYGRWDCRSNQVTGTVPASPGGPRYGTIATAFDCIEGGRTAVIGIIHFVTGAGCVDLIESDDPLGTHVVSGDACTSTPVWGESWGRVCVGSGGLDGCEPPLPLLPAVPLAGCSPLADLATPVPCVTPVDPSTWGIIKHLHR